MLENLHPGDKVEVTYTTALLIKVEEPASAFSGGGLRLKGG